MNLAFLNIGTQEMVLIVLVALFLFGGKKLPELARGLGRGIREFKDASDGIKKEISDQINNFEKELDVDVDEKPAQTKETSKASAVSQEIKTHSGPNQKAAMEKNAHVDSAESKLPKFGPPAGTYQHNPKGAEAKTEEEEQYYQYGYTDHFESQNEVDYTPPPEDEIPHEHHESSASSHDEEPVSKDT